MSGRECEWFAEWFDTHYYHLLYRNRDNEAAKLFITRLLGELTLDENASVLDLACGKGRHSRTLAEQGFRIVGADLSSNSIEAARLNAPKNAEFIVHDMREVIPNQSFDAIFNLFTSFGYFDSMEENAKVVAAIHTMLKPNGFLVIDFMNTQRIIEGLVAKEVKESSGIHFHIERKVEGEHIVKTIAFEDKGRNFQYEERVQHIHLALHCENVL